MAAEPIGSVLVVGGGISGIRAALDLVECGFSVHIVESKPALGGVMAQLDRIFPSNDCSLCLLAPQMVECDRNENIQLHTNSTLLGLEGEPGRFIATIWRQPTYIDMAKCVACHKCVEACPKCAPDEFNEQLDQRKAAYILYRQAVPLQYVIDDANCLRFNRVMGGACENVCPADAINFKDEGSVERIEVGAVLLAPGVKPFDPSGRDIYGYGEIPDVYTSLEFERLISASGPGMGALRRRSDFGEPRSIAWLQCVGSRDIHRSFCSNICCMYAIKQAMAAPDHMSPGHFEATIFYTDIRTPGKGHEKLLNAALSQGVRFVRARPHTVLPGPKGRGVVLDWAEDNGKMNHDSYDMLVLSVGMEPGEKTVNLCHTLGVDLNCFDFVDSSSFSPHRTSRPGIYATGGILGPKDIAQSVTEASAAAAAATAELIEARWSLIKPPPTPTENTLSNGPPRVGVFLCKCGTSTSAVLDFDTLTEYATSLPNVAYAETNAFTCPLASQKRIINLIREKKLNRIVVGACTPKTHEPLYQQTLCNAGLNSSLLEMVNLRNHIAWTHQDQPLQALDKAKDQVRAAVCKATMLAPVQPLRKRVTRQALVVGGGLAGMTAALTLADQGVETVLVEKKDHLGGVAWKLRATWVGEDISVRLEKKIHQIFNHPLITVLTNTQILSSQGSAGDFTVRLQLPERTGTTRESTMNFGAVILCVGGKERQTSEYLHGQDNRVLTQLEFDRLIREKPALFKTPRRIAFIQCVGSREPGKTYCSRVCCTHTIETALRLKELSQATQIMIFHRDVRTFGLREMNYHEALRRGVLFVRYTPKRKPRIRNNDKFLEVRALDPILGRFLAFNADYVVLAVAIEPNPKNKTLAEIFRCSIDRDGFFIESGRFMKPVDLEVNGVFVAGLCHSPMPVDEAVSQGQAAAFRACRILCRDEIVLGTVKAEITSACDGCGLCVSECRYGAISGTPIMVNDEERLKITIDPMLCEGCGVCQAICPVGGIRIPGFSSEQIRAQAMSLARKTACDTKTFEPSIVAFCCNWCSYIAADMAGVLRLQYPPNVRIVRVMCAGMVNQNLVLELFRNGADGVAILGCRPGECNYTDGNLKAGNWAVATRARMKKTGINPKRFMLDGVASSEGQEFAELIRNFTETIKELGPVECKKSKVESHISN